MTVMSDVVGVRFQNADNLAWITKLSLVLRQWYLHSLQPATVDYGGAKEVPDRFSRLFPRPPEFSP